MGTEREVTLENGTKLTVSKDKVSKIGRKRNWWSLRRCLRVLRACHPSRTRGHIGATSPPSVTDNTGHKRSVNVQFGTPLRPTSQVP